MQLAASTRLAASCAPASPRAQTQSNTPRKRAVFMPEATMSANAGGYKNLDVAVIGGGPGGLAAAKAILAARCTGPPRPDLKVEVFERATLRPRGAVLSVQANGLRALEAIDPALKAAVEGIHSPLGTRWHILKDGSVLSVEEQDGESGAGQRALFALRHSGLTPVGCAWHELQSTLASQLPPGVLHQQVAYDRYEEGPNGVTVHFKGDSHPPVTARVLVGCDGGQSAVRAQCIGDGPPLFAGTAIWRAVLPRLKLEWWPKEPGAHCIFGVPPAMVLSFSIHEDTVGWQSFVPWPEERLDEIGGIRASYTQDPLALQEQGEARKRRALEAFEGWCPQVRSLIEAADPLAITEHPQLYRPPESCRVWGKGRITLLGDAAHLATPMLSQGTSQAFEDSVALGHAIAEHGPTPQALRAYEAFRQPQMELVHNKSLEMFKVFREGGPPAREHEESHKLGVWRRTFDPLRPPSMAAS